MKKSTTRRAPIFYALTNPYADAHSPGFRNTWQMHAFSSKAARDAFVESRDDAATRACTAREGIDYIRVSGGAKNYAPAPSSGEYWGIDPWRAGEYGDAHIGDVDVLPPDSRAYCPGVYA